MSESVSLAAALKDPMGRDHEMEQMDMDGHIYIYRYLVGAGTFLRATLPSGASSAILQIPQGWRQGSGASCAGPALYNARDKFGPRRFAILDTDRHHGNGTREIFLEDNDMLHVCFCGWDRIEGNGTKVCVNTAFPINDESYMEKVREAFIARAKVFRPDMILHNLGHDTCQLDYGDLGLTPDFFPRLVKEIKACAEEICQGRYLVLTHGGRRADVAEYIFPRIVEIMAEK